MTCLPRVYAPGMTHDKFGGWGEMLEAASGDARRLSYVVRYSSIPVSVPENVAEHSFWVTFYSLLVHRALRPEDQQIVGAITTKAVMHDMAECVTGDIVRTFKYSSESLRHEIEKAEEKIVHDFPPSMEGIYKSIDPMSNGEERYVKSVVKAADFMSLHQYMMREVRRGNREIMRFYVRMETDLMKMSSDLRESARIEDVMLSGLYKEMVDMAKSVRSGG